MKDIMMNTTLEVLREEAIDVFRINLVEKETAELFYIKKNLDMRRRNDVITAQVTVYHDFERGRKKYRGDAVCIIEPSNTKDEIAKKIRVAYETALFVPNEFYPIAPKLCRDVVKSVSKIAEKPLLETALDMAEGFFKEDTDDKAFVNSAEFFVSKTTSRIVNSNGVDVSYEKYGASGEFVVQCKEPQDVETYQGFNFDDLSPEELSKMIHRTIVRTKDRATAKNTVPSGKYQVILSDDSLREVLSFYTSRASGNMLYFQYSDYKIGESVQGNLEEVNGQRMNLSLEPSVPFSGEGIEMKEITLVKDGVLENIQADCRFGHYIDVKPTGLYSKVCCSPGTVSLDDMRKEKSLYIVNFSDFQMDFLTGNFGGEIRLAYYFDGKETIPVTGGSVNGDFLSAQKDMVFSKEMQENSSFCGPYAVMLKDISVAGE